MELDAARLRLLELINEEGTDLATVSKEIGKNHAYLQQYIKRGTPRRLPEDVREALARRFGGEQTEFRGDALQKSQAKARELISLDGNDYAMLPVYDLRLSAGPGAWTGDFSEPLHYEPHRLQWLRSITAASPEMLIIARVEGDSMETTLFSGDQVLIDRPASAGFNLPIG